MNELQIIFINTVILIAVIVLIVLYILLHIGCWFESFEAKAFFIGVDCLIIVIIITIILGEIN